MAMRDNVVEVFSSGDARQEAERHRRDLADTLDTLSERVGGAIEQLEHQLTFPARWAADHPLASVGLGLAAGLLLGARLEQKPRAPRANALARELEGAYLQGRRDENEQRPPREPEYWAGVKLADGPDLGSLLMEAAKPLLAHFASGMADSFRNGTGGRE